MEWKYAAAVTVLLILAMILAGCSDSAPVPESTPVPVPVASAVKNTPAPAPSAALTTTRTTAPETMTTVRTTVRMTELTHEYSKTYTFEGTGDYIQEFTTDTNRIWVFRITSPGDEEFMAAIRDRNGDEVEVLAVRGNIPAGPEYVHLDAGTYSLDVSAGAPWTITMSTT